MNMLTIGWKARNVKPRRSELSASRPRIGLIAMVAGVLLMAAAAAALPAYADPPSVVDVDVMNVPVRGGEPELAINQLNPQNLLIGHTSVANTFANENAITGPFPCGFQSSFDAGKTWTSALDQTPCAALSFSEGPNPFLISLGFTGATGFTLTTKGLGDEIAASAPDGAMYGGGVVANAVLGALPGSPFPFTVPQGAIEVSRSTDGGLTFATNSSVLSDLELPGMISRGMSPSTAPGQGIGIGVNPFDRPWIAVDQSTGVVYISGTAHPQRYVVASHDKAQTWSRIEAVDCDEMTPPDANHDEDCGAYPESGGGGIDAAQGAVAAAYISGAAPGRTCPCAVFETSIDDGAHWSRHVVFDTLPPGSNVFVAADSNHKGRYAVLLLPGHLESGGLAGLPPSRNVPQEVEVATTDDSGLSWSSPTVLGNEPVTHITSRPWISYTSVLKHRGEHEPKHQQGSNGPTGVLAILWRNAYPPFDRASFLVPGTQNVFTVISRNNGETFSAPVQLNSASSPAPDPKQVAEDDVSWVAANTEYVFGAWGDWRATANNPVAPGSSPPSGELNSWIGRASLSSFRGDD
jgi:hypothetical protein